MINNVLILDTETTGLNPEEGAEIIEVACILFNVKSKMILQEISTLLPVEKNDCENVNKISSEASRLIGFPQAHVMCATIDVMAKQADIIMAHNAEFDKNFISHSILKELSEKRWLCTCHDFTWPYLSTGPKTLVNIALMLDVPVVRAHRALADCQLLAYCLQKVSKLDEYLEKALNTVRYIYVADVSFDNKHLAKEKGFQWNNIVRNRWAAKLSEEEAALIDTFQLKQYSDGF